jgi:hypothetical protein
VVPEFDRQDFGMAERYRRSGEKALLGKRQPLLQADVIL